MAKEKDVPIIGFMSIEQIEQVICWMVYGEKGKFSGIRL